MYFNIFFFIFSKNLRGPEGGPKGGPERSPEGGSRRGGPGFVYTPTNISRADVSVIDFAKLH